jgi:hypothetical protein
MPLRAMTVKVFLISEPYASADRMIALEWLRVRFVMATNKEDVKIPIAVGQRR